MTEPLELIRTWDGHATVLRFEPQSGTWIVIALHDRTLGPPTGGSRMKPYPSLSDAIVDAQRLAAGMTAKWAGIDRPYGGGKAVLMIPGPLDAAARRSLLVCYRDVIQGLGGGFRTGPDMGTTPEDMATLAEACDFVMGIHPDTGRPLDPGPYTAQGVFAGIRQAIAHAFDGAPLAGRRVLVEGVGDVGAPLARRLAEAGATILLTDLDLARSQALARELGGQAIAPEAVFTTDCDVYAPCAVGATVNEESVAQMRCAIVAGSANNQLATDADGERLAARGILYAPDWVINAGGALAFADLQAGSTDTDQLLIGVDDAIGAAIDAVFCAARTEGITPLEAARRRADRRLAQAAG